MVGTAYTCILASECSYITGRTKRIVDQEFKSRQRESPMTSTVFLLFMFPMSVLTAVIFWVYIYRFYLQQVDKQMDRDYNLALKEIFLKEREQLGDVTIELTLTFGTRFFICVLQISGVSSWIFDKVLMGNLRSMSPFWCQLVLLATTAVLAEVDTSFGFGDRVVPDMLSLADELRQHELYLALPVVVQAQYVLLIPYTRLSLIFIHQYTDVEYTELVYSSSTLMLTFTTGLLMHNLDAAAAMQQICTRTTGTLCGKKKNPSFCRAFK
ncbi:hypothetical protein V5799_021530 [Amblyomma americanum]|uniref:Uncharacterized protein n=1 Tax=Amblyomma americanum TaxID=6943 RepID=A0AAQ4FPN3_AMBAM